MGVRRAKSKGRFMDPFSSIPLYAHSFHPFLQTTTHSLSHQHYKIIF